MCLKCGNKFQNCTARYDRELKIRRQRTTEFINNKNHNSKYSNIDCPTQCPKCSSDNIEKKEKYMKCNKCKYFDKIEVFEGV